MNVQPEEWIITGRFDMGTKRGSRVTGKIQRRFDEPTLEAVQLASNPFRITNLWAYGTPPKPEVALLLYVDGYLQPWTPTFSSVRLDKHTRNPLRWWWWTHRDYTKTRPAILLTAGQTLTAKMETLGTLPKNTAMVVSFHMRADVHV